MIEDEQARARKRILRKAATYSWAFLGAALGTAIVGAALVAWLLSHVGWPFLPTWLVLVCVVLLPSLIGMGVRAMRGRNEPDTLRE